MYMEIYPWQISFNLLTCIFINLNFLRKCVSMEEKVYTEAEVRELVQTAPIGFWDE
jgi:hypothetical protein